MKAVVFDAIGKAEVREVPVPHAGPGEVVIKVEAAGLCGSDYHIFHGTYPAVYPLIPGHEFAGSISQLGDGVTGWKVHDRVTADPNCYCGNCYYCKRDQENMCESPRVSGVNRDGGFAEYVLVPESQLYRLPDNISWDEGAMVEPLSCVVYGINRLAPRFGDSALIFGAGPMGLMMSNALRIGGVSKVVISDISPERLKTAEMLGAEACYDPAGLPQKFPRGFDLVIDCTGNPDVIRDMFRYAAKRARILQFGCADTSAKVELSPFNIYDNDWEYIGTRALLKTFHQAIELIAGRRITGDKIINDAIPLEKLPYYLQGGKPASSLKVIVKPGL